MTKEQARARLVLFHDISEPTEQEVAMFLLYGVDAPFLKDKGRAQIVNKESGGLNMTDKELQQILLNFRGTKQLLTLLCNSTKEIKVSDFEGNAQESLFLIEDVLDKNIIDLEAYISRR